MHSGTYGYRLIKCPRMLHLGNVHCDTKTISCLSNGIDTPAVWGLLEVVRGCHHIPLHYLTCCACSPRRERMLRCESSRLMQSRTVGLVCEEVCFGENEKDNESRIQTTYLLGATWVTACHLAKPSPSTVPRSPRSSALMRASDTHRFASKGTPNAFLIYSTNP